ncbi:hypothetical protein EYC84_006290 [Monilinia fructicola]|uniref:Uncharacterized protein n=1 Tax=Monilinia fructicola TaxID=38448 RepID=A0A5M9K5C8_MONFR|nr:hypothetical protein EYC84_006290 [Monilinia fructicola]
MSGTVMDDDGNEGRVPSSNLIISIRWLHGLRACCSKTFALSIDSLEINAPKCHPFEFVVIPKGMIQSS